MKPHSFLLIMLLGIALHTYAQTVTNVRFEQVDNQVKITYNLDEEADISVSISEDGGKTWCIIEQVSGDVGKQVSAGDNEIYWDVLSERKQLVRTEICFKVVASAVKNRKQHYSYKKAYDDYKGSQGLFQLDYMGIKLGIGSAFKVDMEVCGVRIGPVFINPLVLSIGYDFKSSEIDKKWYDSEMVWSYRPSVSFYIPWDDEHVAYIGGGLNMEYGELFEYKTLTLHPNIEIGVRSELSWLGFLACRYFMRYDKSFIVGISMQWCAEWRL